MTPTVTNAVQLRELLLYGGMGFLLGGYYDVFRVLRCVLRPGGWRVLVQDLLFFATAAPAVFLCTLALNGGVVRVYLYVGLLAGFWAYRHTVGRAVVRAASLLIARAVALGEVVHRRLAVVGRRVQSG